MITELGSGWAVTSGDATFAIGVDRDGTVVQTYFGPTLPRREDYPPADLQLRAPLPAWQLPSHYKRPLLETGDKGSARAQTISAQHSDGSRGLVLTFKSVDITEGSLTVHLHDKDYSVAVQVVIRALPTAGLFQSDISVTNDGPASVLLNRCMSLSLHMPDRDTPYAATYFDGEWADEMRPHRDEMTPGLKTRESRRMVSGFEGPPFVAIDHAHPSFAAREDGGDVWFTALHWSGNWRMEAERTSTGLSAIHVGANDFDFAWPLKKGARYNAPSAMFGYTDAGFGAMSRALHDYHRDHLAPRQNHVPPVVYNSWYPTEFDITEDQQIELAKRAARIGVEMFVLDDGWFSGRVDSRAGLGDWWVDAKKFPKGLGHLATSVHDLGMGFGLWIEPEMVNRDSDLYRQSPDWVLYDPKRPHTEIRDQLMLNLGREDVQDYLIESFDRLLRDTPIDFIKWDMNRPVADAGWPDHDSDQREIWVRHTHGLYRLYDTLRERHPSVIWENCASGGGRLDWGMMTRTEQSWASDNISAPARLHIQHNYSKLFPAGTMASWVCDDPTGRSSLDFRFHMAMAGALGIGADLMLWDDATLTDAAAHITRYKGLRPIIVDGDQHRLSDVTTTGISAPFFVAKDKDSAILFTSALAEGRAYRSIILKPVGLDPDKIYEVEGQPETLSGRAWMVRGIRLTLAPYISSILCMESVTRNK